MARVLAGKSSALKKVHTVGIIKYYRNKNKCDLRSNHKVCEETSRQGLPVQREAVKNKTKDIYVRKYILFTRYVHTIVHTIGF